MGIGQNIVCGSKKRSELPTKILERPPHTAPPATWHLNRDLASMGDSPLKTSQCEAFFEDGFVLLPDFYNAEALDAVRKDVEGMIESLAQRLFKAGKIKDLYADLDWTSRLLQMRRDFPDAPVVLIKGGILPPALQAM